MRIVVKIIFTLLVCAVGAWLSQGLLHNHNMLLGYTFAGTVYGIWKWDFWYILHGAVVGFVCEIVVRYGYTILWLIPALYVVVIVIVSLRKKSVAHKANTASTKTIKADRSDEQYYAQAAEEFESGNIQKGLFTKAEVEAGGDKNQTRLIYIQHRVGQLMKEDCSDHPNTVEDTSANDSDGRLISDSNASVSKRRSWVTCFNIILFLLAGVIIFLLAVVIIIAIMDGGSQPLNDSEGNSHSPVGSAKKVRMPVDAISQRVEIVENLSDAEVAPQQGEIWVADLGGRVFMEFMPIPAGRFMMRSAESVPEHQVVLSKSFWMAKTEVTQEQYEAVMGINPAEMKGQKNPVESVSLADAMEFCRRLTRQEYLEGRLASWFEYNLPTETQWVYACQAGEKNDKSHNLAAFAWYRDNSNDMPHLVGQKLPNAWGLYDMQGNVSEWLLDQYEQGWEPNLYYDGVVDPIGTSGSYRSAKGGAYCGTARACAPYWFTTSHFYGEANQIVGFRPILISKQ